MCLSNFLLERCSAHNLSFAMCGGLRPPPASAESSRSVSHPTMSFPESWVPLTKGNPDLDGFVVVRCDHVEWGTDEAHRDGCKRQDDLLAHPK